MLSVPGFGDFWRTGVRFVRDGGAIERLPTSGTRTTAGCYLLLRSEGRSTC
jgi:hypothetical protein